MKRSNAKKPIRTEDAKVRDNGRVRLGNMSPAFPLSAPTRKIADGGKVRIGNMSPSF